jgi:hypothetical protein
VATVVKGSIHRAKAYKPHERPGKGRRPAVLLATIQKLQDAITTRQGPLWEWLCANIPASYDEDGNPNPRRRRLRAADGAVNFAAVVCKLLEMAELGHGLIAKPGVATGESYHRYDVATINRWSYGDPIPQELSLARTERWLRALSAMGWIQTRQLRVAGSNGYRSVVAVRHLSDRLFKIVGTYGDLKRARRQRKFRRNKEDMADRLRVAQRADQRRTHGRNAGDLTAIVGGKRNGEAGQSPPSTAGPPSAHDVGMQHIAKIAAILFPKSK